MPVRRDLAKSVQRILAVAGQPAVSRRLPVAVCLDRVWGASDDFRELICRLITPGPVSARGVAKVSILFGDAQGPLYHRPSGEDLGARVREAADALNPLRES